MREHNERLVLSLVRRQGPKAKSEIARTTGLSAQTVSVIMRGLEAEGLLQKGDPVRGKVGQPSVPMRLAEDGAYFFGLKIGRRSADLVLTNFLGKVIARVHLTHRHPTPDATIRFARDAMEQLAGQLDPADRGRIAGLGIAIPFQLWDWAKVMGLAPEKMAEWQTRDIRAELQEVVEFPVFLQNDASCACGAELVFGPPETPQDFLYFYIGFFVGGGVVLNSALYTGRTGNAAALGSLPVPDGAGGSRQLIDVASLAELERMLEIRGRDANSLWETPTSWLTGDDVLEEWIAAAARGLAYAVAAASAVIDFEAALIDGWMPAPVRTRLVQETRTALGLVNLAGLTPPALREGSIGPDARALGAASLPLSERFLVSRHVFQSAG